jgi:outer membrane protein TolC
MLQLLFFFLLSPWVVLCQAQTTVPRTLSLNDAILLALRENPNVQRKQLATIQAKYALELAQWHFKPHYEITASKLTSQNYSSTQAGEVTQNTTGITPQVTLNTPFGTDITVAASNDLSKNYHPGVSLTVIQPLIRGFGRPIVEAALQSAKEDVTINHLQMEETLRNTITSVINDYLSVISAEKTLEVDQSALKRSQKSVEQTKLFIKAGRKPGAELVTAEAEAANTQAKIEGDHNALAQAHAKLLQTIGMDPATPILFTDISVPALIKKYHIPSLEDTKKLVTTHNVSYQVAQITYEGSTKRSVAAAQNDRLWKLNLTATAATGNGNSGGQNAGLNSLVNGVNRTDSVRLDLTIPIDDQSAKIALEKAKIGLRDAAIGLKEEKWRNETMAIDTWNNVFSAERSLKLSEHAEALQQKAYDISEQKYKYGLIDSIELQLARQQYMAAQQQFVTQQIGYLTALVALDQLIGRTLQTWNIQVGHD